MVPPITRSPAPFSTGIDSPVSIDSSTALSPERISPSTGMRSPGRTSSTSPGTTWPTGTSISAFAADHARTVGGCSSTSARNAVDVRRFARASSTLPVSTSAMMMITGS